MQYKFSDAVKWLQHLLKIKSVEEEPLENAPFGKGVAEALDFSLSLMQQLGFSTKDIDGYCGWGEVGSGDAFGILVHLDVVPEGKEWDYPPYGAIIENGNLYGRGALDNKGPFIACLFAVVKLLQESRLPKKRIRFILGCDEESGWKCIERYQQTEEMPNIGFSPDADFPVINCEKGIVYHELSFSQPDGIFHIEGGERANMVADNAYCKCKYHTSIEERAKALNLDFKRHEDTITLICKGVSAHGSAPKKGDNALYKLFYCLGTVYPIFDHLFHAFNTSDGANINLKLFDKKSGHLTLNLGTCKLIDKKIVCELDIRYPISYNKNYITQQLQENLACEVKQGFYHNPLYVDENHTLVRTLLKAYDEVMGNTKPSSPIAIGGGTYARALPLGVAFGPILPGMESTIHEKNEFISLSHYKILIDIYYKAIKELCFYD